jgi:hypothetical protein
MILDEDHVIRSLRSTWQPVANAAGLAPGAVTGVTLLETELVLARFADGRLLAVLAAVVFAILDAVSPSMGVTARQGASFGIGANLVGFPKGL